MLHQNENAMGSLIKQKESNNHHVILFILSSNLPESSKSCHTLQQRQCDWFMFGEDTWKCLFCNTYYVVFWKTVRGWGAEGYAMSTFDQEYIWHYCIWIFALCDKVPPNISCPNYIQYRPILDFNTWLSSKSRKAIKSYNFLHDHILIWVHFFGIFL